MELRPRGSFRSTAGSPVQVFDLAKLDIDASSVSMLPDGRLIGILTSPLERDEVTGANLVLDLHAEPTRKLAAAR